MRGAYQNNPTSPKAHYQLSLVYARLGDEASSEKHREVYQKMMREANVQNASTKFDTADAHTMMDPEKIASKGIVYKYSMVGIDENTIGHNAVPKVYIPLFLKAAGNMGPAGVALASRTQVKVKRVM